MKAAFHLAFPVKSLGVTKMFYNEVLGCPIGRSSDHWVDFNFFGHQISAHLSLEMDNEVEMTEVEGKKVPLRHFGAILSMEDWTQLAQTLKVSGTEFIIEPQVRYKGKKGEQHIMFVYDPSGNALEFKAFSDDSEIFT